MGALAGRRDACQVAVGVPGIAHHAEVGKRLRQYPAGVIVGKLGGEPQGIRDRVHISLGVVGDRGRSGALRDSRESAEAVIRILDGA